MNETPLSVLAWAMRSRDADAARTLDRIVAKGYRIVAEEEMAQLRDSYVKMRDKYYSADEEMHMLRMAMRGVLDARKVVEQDDADVAPTE